MAMAIAFSYATPAAAQGAYPTLRCDACRNPRIHYRDYRNFAYNQIFSPGGWMTYGNADIFRTACHTSTASSRSFCFESTNL
jgi:hypothetical protein